MIGKYKKFQSVDIICPDPESEYEYESQEAFVDINSVCAVIDYCPSQNVSVMVLGCGKVLYVAGRAFDIVNTIQPLQKGSE